MVGFKCQQCGTELKASEEHRGMATVCPGCEAHVQIPESPSQVRAHPEQTAESPPRRTEAADEPDAEAAVGASGTEAATPLSEGKLEGRTNAGLLIGWPLLLLGVGLVAVQMMMKAGTFNVIVIAGSYLVSSFALVSGTGAWTRTDGKAGRELVSCAMVLLITQVLLAVMVVSGRYSPLGARGNKENWFMLSALAGIAVCWPAGLLTAVVCELLVLKRPVSRLKQLLTLLLYALALASVVAALKMMLAQLSDRSLSVHPVLWITIYAIGSWLIARGAKLRKAT
jgi:DNA-directed RNA polymerase subunit RPC12/RpoP